MPDSRSGRPVDQHDNQQPLLISERIEVRADRDADRGRRARHRRDRGDGSARGVGGDGASTADHDFPDPLSGSPCWPQVRLAGAEAADQAEKLMTPA
jgi:hypothetical protein